MKSTWRNWLKASFLTVLFYLLVGAVLVRMALPRPVDKPEHTPMKLSMFEMPPSRPVQPTTASQQSAHDKVSKNAQKNQPDEEPGYLDPKRQNKPTDANLSVMQPLAPVPPMPSFSQINALFQPKKVQKGVNPQLKELYGNTVDELAPEALEYLEDNLNRIGYVTQQYLEFPTLGGDLGMQGETILAFDLYPNGDISDIKLLQSSGYTLLDDNAVETVEVAYKEYPHPKVVTPIRLLVKYINQFAR